MRLRVEGFLLFAFGFSSALTFNKTLDTSAQVKNVKTTSKSIISNLTETQNAENESVTKKAFDNYHGLDKRSAEISTQTDNREENKKEFFEPNLDLKQDAPNKRARVGFTGMRGKKEYSADDYCSRNLRARLEGALNKRFLTNFNELLGGKRAGLAFHGMRGKKSRDYDSEILNPETIDFSPPQEFLISSGLMEETEPSEVAEEKRSEEGGVGGEEEREEEGWSKRSPYGSQGMRGKQEYAYDLKRAMGFLGMRGKKATDVWDSDYKRAPQSSFFGMKGKKAQSSGFFGMRGKKASPNAFFGIKGKREPLGYNLQDFSLLNQMKESVSSNNRFRRGITWFNNSKKAKNAFFGIRGKKSNPEKMSKSDGSDAIKGSPLTSKEGPFGMCNRRAAP